MDWPVIASLILGVTAIVPALLLTLQTWEFRRFVRSRIAHPKQQAPTQRVALFAPCKGLEAGLKENLRPLFEQDHGDYRLVLVVERADDPACGPIRELMAEYRYVRSRLTVAGLAVTCGQKVHNLLAATAELEDAEVLAFVDSDARPRRDWLLTLVQHLNHPSAAAATGYRWFVPLKNTLPNLLLHSLNASVAALVGPGRHHMVWGGAWAIRRDVFESIDLRGHWQGTLSDDLVAARQLARNGKKTEFEPACMTVSPIDVSWRQMVEFVRRQYTVARFYTPDWWRLALVFCTLSQLAFWGGLLATVVAVVLRADWFLIPALISALMYATYQVRAALRQDAASYFLPNAPRSLAAAERFDIWFSPLAGLVNWIGLVGSLCGNGITWRSITYAIERGGRIRILRRTDVAESLLKTPPAAPLRKAG